MAIVMMLSLLCTTAFAADIHLNVGPATVYVDNVKVSGITAYMDGEDHVRVETQSDMFKIFSTETNGVFLSPSDSLIVTDWADYFGYGWSQSESSLYIYKNGSTPTFPNQPGIPSMPGTDGKTPAEVFVNGLRINDTGVHVYGGEFFVSSSAAIRAIFPKETAGVYFPAVMETSTLKSWATKYKYTMVSTGNRVYLNNNGKAALELSLNGEHVSFEDQQPIVVDPGRTMVPLRTIAEQLGFTVEYVSQNNGVKMTKGTTEMWLWPTSSSSQGSNQYYLNGKYYTMDVKPFILNGRTMVPIRFVGEVFGYTVKWDGSGSVAVVRLTSSK